MFVVFLVLFISNRLSTKSTTEVEAESSIESKIAAEVASKYAVPAGVPIVTRVSDVAVLASVNSFYKDVRDGDWLLRYDGLLIAYRREEGRVLNVLEINKR